MPKPKKPPAQPEKLDLDALALQLSVDDVKYLLSVKGRLIKERMALGVLRAMEDCLDPKIGVDVTFNGEVTGHRRASPGEVFRIQQALAKFDPADFNSILQNADTTAAGNMAAKMDDLDELSRATGGGAES